MMIRQNPFYIAPLALLWILGMMFCTGCNRTESPQPPSEPSPSPIAQTSESSTNEEPEVEEVIVPEESKPAYDEEAAAADWKWIRQKSQPPHFPREWLENPPTDEDKRKYRQSMADQALEGSALARKFYRDFPNHPNVAEAKNLEHSLLRNAMNFGAEEAQRQLADLDEKRMRDESVLDDERIPLYEMHVRRAMSSGDTSFDAVESAEKAVREMLREFPSREEGWTLFLMVAQRASFERQTAMIEEILNGEAPESVQERAKRLKSQDNPMNQKLEFNFTSVDGQKVDLKDYQGRIVILDFWATWCGPCIAALPELKDLYSTWHPKGLEIIGVSLDQDQKALEQFIQRNDMPWPQFFDGNGWKNELAAKHGIREIPTLWLIDREGIVRDTRLHGNLKKVVEWLEKSSESN